MKLSRLLIALVILVGLAGALWWSNKKEDEKAKNPPPDTTTKILALTESNIVGLEIKKRAGEDTVLSKNDSGVWSITAPKPLPADQSSVASIITASGNLPADRTIDDNATDLASYGLAPAADEVVFKMKDGKTKTLLIGDSNPTGNDVYAKVGDDKHLYTMGSSSKTTFDKESKDLRDKRLLTFDQEKATHVELNAKKESIEFGRINQTDWQILKPKPLRADGFAVEELVRKLKEANMDTSMSDEDAKKAAAAFATATPVATVKVTDPGGTQTLEIRKAKGKEKDSEDYYAKSSVVEGVYKVSKDLGTGVDKGLDDFRNKKVFDFGFSDPTKIDFKDGTRTATYQKFSDKWMSNGKTMDSTAVQALVDKLRDLSAAKFVEGGFGVAQVEIAVVSNDGKRTERVYIAPGTDGKFIAKREGEAAMYQLDGNTIAELRGVAADVKEAAKEEASKPGAAKKK
jgi:ribosomal protein L12E/L44/L45/RPP1/RPP2